MATSPNATQITPPRVALIDERTGAVSREWYRWFYSLYNIVGGGLGIVPVASGGTGLSTIPTNGQLLIGNGTGYTLNTLGVGAGLSVTNGIGTITLANTGVLSFSGGTTGLTPSAVTTGAITLAGTLVIANGGTNGSATPTAGAVAYGTGTAYAFTAAGTAGQVLTSNGAGVPTWTTNAGGDVTGPASSTDNAIARFDGVTGKLIQSSLVIVDDTGSVTGVNSLTAESLTVNNNTTLGFSNTDTLDVRARIISDLEPNTNNAKDIGTSGRNWRDGFFGRNLDTVNLSVTGTTSFDGSQGTVGQVLTSAGTGATPTWTTPTTGTVTSVSVVSANGFAGTVATATTTPAITLTTSITGVLKGNGTAISAAVVNTDYFAPSAPVTKTADFTVAATEVWLINNKSGSTCTVTLPTASSWTGRVLRFQNYQVQTVVSASSNVVPLAGGAAGTSILLASSGDSATLVSDGSNWLMTQYIPNNILLLE